MANYEIIPISDDAWRIEDEAVRCFLFTGQDYALLVDTGFGEGEADLKAIVDSLTDLPVILVITHADHDHIGCNHQFDTAFMHPAELYHHGLSEKNVNAIWENDLIGLGGRSFEVIHIPGHTPGSIALLDRKNRILVGGDSVQIGPIYMFGPMRSFPAYLHSLERLEDYMDSFDTVYPSHNEFPVPASIIPVLREAGERLLRGEGKAEMVELHGVKELIPLYDMGEVKFLYKPDGT
jgi:Zn-dependent hydrolases, including glyoxylases